MKRICFKDFDPEMIDPGGFLRPAVLKSLDEAVQEANLWIEDNAIDVVNIETVLLPNIHSPHEEGSEDSQLRTAGEMGAYWYQVYPGVVPQPRPPFLKEIL